MSREQRLVEAAFTRVQRGVESGDLPTAVLALGDRERILRLEAFGATTTDAIYLIASITKPIFVASLLDLVERGLLLLNDPVGRFLPSFATGAKAQVTLWHLLTHTSGLDDGPTMARLIAAGRTPSMLVDAALSAQLLFTPGSHYTYCNASYVVMAEVIRVIRGVEHDIHTHESILAPLGMRDTAYSPPDPARAIPIAPPEGVTTADERPLADLKFPAGGLWSSAPDLMRFGQMLLGRGTRAGTTVLTPASVAAMTQLHTQGLPAITADGTFAAGYGLGVGKSVPGRWRAPSTELHHSSGFGHGGATGTLLWVEPSVDLVFVFLTNRFGLDSPHARQALNASIAAFSL